MDLVKPIFRISVIVSIPPAREIPPIPTKNGCLPFSHFAAPGASFAQQADDPEAFTKLGFLIYPQYLLGPPNPVPPPHYFPLRSYPHLFDTKYISLLYISLSLSLSFRYSPLHLLSSKRFPPNANAIRCGGWLMLSLAFPPSTFCANKVFILYVWTFSGFWRSICVWPDDTTNTSRLSYSILPNF